MGNNAGSARGHRRRGLPAPAAAIVAVAVVLIVWLLGGQADAAFMPVDKYNIRGGFLGVDDRGRGPHCSGNSGLAAEWVEAGLSRAVRVARCESAGYCTNDAGVTENDCRRIGGSWQSKPAGEWVEPRGIFELRTVIPIAFGVCAVIALSFCGYRLCRRLFVKASMPSLKRRRVARVGRAS